MHRAQLIVVLACALGLANADIKPDWNKLLDFSTHFTMNFDASDFLSSPDVDPDHPPQIPSTVPKTWTSSGEMNLDVFGEKYYGKQTESYTLASGEEGHDSGEMYFDGVAGEVAIKMEGKIPGVYLGGLPGDLVLEPSCVKIRLPQGMLPPPSMLKAQIEPMEPQVTQTLQMIPQQDATVDGEPVHVLEGFPIIGVADDATPVGVGFHPPGADGTWTPVLKFTNWKKGAHIPDMTCTETSAVEVLANPVAKRSLRMLDRMMGLARGVQPLQLAFQHLPAKPSLLLEGAAATSRSLPTSAPGMMPTLVVAFAAGTLASLLVFVVLKPRRTHGTRLLENMA
jgi:hypothetical protein